MAHTQNGHAPSDSAPAGAADYDLNTPLSTAENPAFGLRSGLTSYGDAHFSLFLRKVFIKGLGFGDDACKSAFCYSIPVFAPPEGALAVYFSIST
jgi:hypothetical protein